jgi:Fe2+ transport system protein A
MVLQEARVGQIYLVEEVDLPLQLERRLEALGIISGTKIKVLNRKPQGALVIFVRGTRFAIGSGIAENIRIREAEA